MKKKTKNQVQRNTSVHAAAKSPHKQVSPIFIILSWEDATPPLRPLV